MLTDLIEKITANPLFLKLKNVVENNSYHNHEDVYSHLIKTKDIAVKEINADFITNPDAKKSFTDFINEDWYGFKRADIMILTTLLHDIGKILVVKEDSQTHPLLVANESDTTACPGHEYWGSTILPEFLKELSIPKGVVGYMAHIIRLHDSFSAEYFQARSNWTFDLLLNDVKSKAEGFYKEAMFNQYCDCFAAKPYELAKEMLIKIFNEPNLYKERHYVIQ